MGLLTQVLLPLILMFMMFTMGLSITFDDLKKVARFPKAFFLGSFLQIITLPLLAFAIASLWIQNYDLNPLHAIGLMIIAACPGGITSNMFTYLAKADLALSISLTSIISLLSVFTTPFIVSLSISYFLKNDNIIDLNVTQMVLGIFAISTIPVIVGMIINHKNPNKALSIESKLKKISAVFFVIITLAAIIKEWRIIYNNFFDVAAITILLNLSCMFLASLISKTFKLNISQKRAIIYECGLQNGTMGIFIALTLLNNGTIVITSAVYSILMFITGGIYLKMIFKNSH